MKSNCRATDLITNKGLQVNTLESRLIYDA